MALKMSQKCQMAHAGISQAPEVLLSGGQSPPFTGISFHQFKCLVKRLLGQTSLRLSIMSMRSSNHEAPLGPALEAVSGLE